MLCSWTEGASNPFFRVISCNSYIEATALLTKFNTYILFFPAFFLNLAAIKTIYNLNILLRTMTRYRCAICSSACVAVFPVPPWGCWKGLTVVGSRATSVLTCTAPGTQGTPCLLSKSLQLKHRLQALIYSKWILPLSRSTKNLQSMNPAHTSLPLRIHWCQTPQHQDHASF